MKTKVWLAELIGTFALVFVGAGAAAVGIGGVVGVALAHGLILAGIIYAFGQISGAHVNPAVTLGVVLTGKLKWREAVWYWVAQLAGGVLAAAGLYFAFGGASNGLGATLPASEVSAPQAVFVEAALTFLFVNTILHTAVKKNGTPFAGLAIGLTLAAAILMGGPLTGASLNPARTFGPALFTGNLGTFWIYLLGPAAGAGLAAWVYRILK
jgi:aquaporin Z